MSSNNNNNNNDGAVLYSGGDDVMGMVMELGSFTCKVGYAGDDFPTRHFRTTTAYNTKTKQTCRDYLSRMLPNEQDEWILQSPIPNYNGGLPNYYNNHNNNNNNNNGGDDELLREYISSCCHENVPVLFIERSYHPPPMRQYLLELLLEQERIPATFLARDAVCACYSVGRTTGMVVDMGHSQTTITPVHEGFVQQMGIQISPLGCHHVHQLLLNQTPLNTAKPRYQLHTPNQQPRSNIFHKASRLAMARECFSSGVLTMEDHDDVNTTTTTASSSSSSYELPDGTVIQIPSSISQQVQNLYFGHISTDRTNIHKNYQKQLEQNSATTTATSSEGETPSSKPKKVDMMEYLHGNSSLLSSNGLRKTTTTTEQPSSKREAFLKACMPYYTSILPQDQLTDAALPHAVCDAAFSCEREVQPSLLGSMIVAGGGSCMDGMTSELQRQVEEVIHPHTPGWRIKTYTQNNYTERSVANWLGGSILASLGSFQDFYITQQEYQEYGPNIVHRKCP